MGVGGWLRTIAGYAQGGISFVVPAPRPPYLFLTAAYAAREYREVLPIVIAIYSR